MANLEVSVEQNECVGCQECAIVAPRHFFMGADGLAYVKRDSKQDPTQPEFYGTLGVVAVAAELRDDVIEAAEVCPGECIHVFTFDNAIVDA